MQVTLTPVSVPQEVSGLAVDSFFGTVRRFREWTTRPSFTAVVDGMTMDTSQVEQAIRDGRVCRCGTCLCCSIARSALWSRYA